MGKLERDPDSGQLATGVATQLGVHDDAFGQRSDGFVMVGHDHVEAELARIGDLGVSADPAVDGDDQADSGRGELVERLGGDAVAVGEPVGQAPDHIGFHVDAQKLAEQERGGDPVGVVVAVHGDRLAASEGAVDTTPRFGHAVEQVRAVDAKVGCRNS